MDFLIQSWGWVSTHKTEIVTVLSYVIAAATIIVKLTPTLKDDNILKGVIKFIGKYIALNR